MIPLCAAKNWLSSKTHFLLRWVGTVTVGRLLNSLAGQPLRGLSIYGKPRRDPGFLTTPVPDIETGRRGHAPLEVGRELAARPEAGLREPAGQSGGKAAFGCETQPAARRRRTRGGGRYLFVVLLVSERRVVDRFRLREVAGR